MGLLLSVALRPQKPYGLFGTGRKGRRGYGGGGIVVECCFTSTETVGLLGTGSQDGHLDFHTALELWGGGRGRWRL